MAATSTYAASWMNLENTLGMRPVLKGSAEELRAQFGGLAQMLASQMPPLSDAVVTQDHSLEGLNLRVYTPRNKSQETLPIGIFAHGGGYVLGSLDSEDAFCRALVEHTSTTIVSVGYRLAPEAKAPAQLDDMVRGLLWAFENATTFNGDPTRIYTVGGSAGGALSLMTTRKVLLGHTPLPKDLIKGIIALVPLVFHPSNIPSQHQPNHNSASQVGTDSPIIDNTSVSQFNDLAGLKPDDIDYFVGLDDGDFLHRLPPTYVCTCEMDPVRDDGRILVQILREYGVQVRHDHFDQLPHVFWLFPTLPEAGTFLQKTFEAVGWIYERMAKK